MNCSFFDRNISACSEVFLQEEREADDVQKIEKKIYTKEEVDTDDESSDEGLVFNVGKTR